MIFNYFEQKFNYYCIKMKFEKITYLLDITSNNKDLPKFVTKKWIEVYMINQKNIRILTKKLELRHQC